MCGIAGVIGHPQAAELTAQITAAQTHRGPDAGSVQTLTSTAAFGHRRLAILDLSDRGAQPMTSHDGRWTIVLNGEIFNYRELRSKLPGPWRSETDTEVFLEAVAAWGVERALASVNGMFGLALWDHREQTLFIARDRIGEKPLVYFRNGQTFAFASEIKALAALHDARLNAEAVDIYLALGYVPAPLGIFRNTYKLAPGHYARFKHGTLDIRRWWFPEEATLRPATNASERAEQLHELLSDAVRLRLRADVPLALSLSGGIDSSVIAAELTRQQAAPDAFTVIFNGDESDLPYAQSVAAKFGLRHEVLCADSAALDSQTATAALQYDEPFADSSSVACLTLARALGERYRVILNGDGGDEAFGGYRHYEFIAVKQAVKAAAAAAGLRDGHATATTYVQSKTTFRSAERAAFLNGHTPLQALDHLLTNDPYLRNPRPGALKRALWSDRHLHLANGLTYKSDIAFAAHGMEGRAPLLDHRILEWAQNLDDHDLVRGREKKVQLREAYRDDLPPGVLTRPKHGFGAPIRQWLAGPLCDMTHSLLPCPLLEAKPQSGLIGQRQWTLLTFALWAKQWRASW